MNSIISIQEIIDEEIKRKREGRESKKQTSWHASSIGNCLRGQYIKRLGILPEPEMDARKLRVFDVGNQMENWVVELFRGKFPGAQTQVRIEDKKLNISGYADIVNGSVYEIKTKHSKAFWYMQKEGKAMRHHEYQVWLYLRVLNIPNGIICYLSKDDMTTAEYIVELSNKELEREVLKRIGLLNVAWKDQNINLLPLQEDTDWTAKYCDYHQYCKFPEKLKNIIKQKKLL